LSFDVDRRLRVEGVKGKGEAHIVDGVLESPSGAALHDDVADVLSRIDLRGIERRVLAWLPGDEEIPDFEASPAFHEVQGPRLLADADHPCEWRHALGERSAVE